MILLFHYTERCTQCLNMERYTRELLDENFADMVADKKIQFRLVEMDKPENRNLVDRFGLFTTTIVLVRFENYKEKKINVLTDSWKYYDDETAFKEMLKKKLEEF